MPVATASHAAQADNTERLLSRRVSDDEPTADAENQLRSRSKDTEAADPASQQDWVSQHSQQLLVHHDTATRK